MKIVIDLLPFNSNLTGTGYYFKRLLSVLQNIDKNNFYELHVLNFSNAVEVFEINKKNFKIVNHTFKEGKLFRIIYEQFIFPFKIKCDLFFSPSVALPLLLNPKIPCITVIHDLIPFIFKKKYGIIQRSYVNFITKLSIKKAKIVVTVSENSKNDIIRILNVNPNKIKIIYNFIEKKDNSDIEAKNKGNYIHTVSTIQPGKNLINLIHAFKKVLYKRKDLKLFIIGGKGWNYQQIFNLVTELDLGQHINFTGYISEDELVQYYKGSKGLVYVSIYEGFGIPPLEAMVYDCPIVVSNTSSLPEVVGDAGILVEPMNIDSIANGIEKLFDETIIDKKKKLFMNQVSKFDGLIEAKKMYVLFEDLKRT